MSPTDPTTRPFIRACRREPVERVPVWLMRQAGRYQPEYRALKDRAGGFWELCTNAEHIAEATLFAQRSLGTDAAIIFSDITMPVWAMGKALEFVPGPKFAEPVRTAADVAALAPIDPATKLAPLLEGIKKTRAGLPDEVSLIGFVGAPLTVAGYLLEGYPSRDWRVLKRVAYGEPAILESLLDVFVEQLAVVAAAQVEAGCDAVQIFDSTAGKLAAAELHRFAFEPSARLLRALESTGVPRIYFARDVGAHLEEAADLGAEVLGVDWTVSMADATRRVGGRVALQGNLDPAVLFCESSVITTRARKILEAAPERGFIFNLGHGVLTETPPEHVEHRVKVVHDWRRS